MAEQPGQDEGKMAAPVAAKKARSFDEAYAALKGVFAGKPGRFQYVSVAMCDVASAAVVLAPKEAGAITEDLIIVAKRIVGAGEIQAAAEAKAKKDASEFEQKKAKAKAARG